MPTVAHRVDELVRQRPGVTRQELREALGTDVDKALMRLIKGSGTSGGSAQGEAAHDIIRSSSRGTEGETWANDRRSVFRAGFFSAHVL